MAALLAHKKLVWHTMKTWINAFCLTCICLCGSFTAKGQHDLSKADSLFSAGKYSDGGLMYLYTEYRSTNPDTLVIARIGQVRCYQQEGHFADACRVIDQTSPFGVIDSLAAYVIYEFILSHYLAGDAETSISKYLQARQILNRSIYQQKTQLILTLCYLDVQNWEQAEKLGLSLVPPAQSATWHSFFGTDSLPKQFNVKLARGLSTFCPGAGQIYTGYIGSGILNFTIHAGILGLSAIGFINGYYLTAWLAGLGLFQKFYFGGVHRAEELCYKKNRQELNKYLLPVKSFLFNQVGQLPTTGPST